MAFLLSGHLLLISLIFLPVVPFSYGPDLVTWMQDGESGVFLEDHLYPTIWNHVGRSPLSRTWLCLARKSRSFRCHKTRRHTSMMILLLMLSGDVEINPGPVTGRNQSEQRDFQSDPFMEKYRDRFLRCMHTYSIAHRLYIYKVIPEVLYHQIDRNLITESEANEKLYLHLRSNAKSDTIHHLCDVMTGQNGYPLMKELGEDMKKDVDLPPSSPSSQPPTVPYPPHPEPTPPSSTLDDERSRKLKQVYKSLQSFYSERLRTVQCTPDVEFVKPGTVEREYHRTKYKKEIEEFLQASIHGIDRYCGSSEKIEYEDILNCVDVVSGKRVLISGAPGCGKTTLSRKLCKDLYSQSLSNQYHLILLVELRWLRLWPNTTKEDIDLEFLFTQYRNILDTSDLCQLLKHNSGEGVALILDGFDEIADQLRNSHFFADLLSVDSPDLCKCDVVITTRPSRCNDLIFLIRRPSHRVEILGFTDAGIDNYIKSFCNGVCKKDTSRAQCMADEMIQKVKSRPLLRGMCRIPRVLEILCKVNEYLGSNPLPETKSGLFSTYICHQLLNYLETSTGQMSSICIEDALHVPTDQFPGFFSLCEVAYKCCIDKTGQRLILTIDDLGDVTRYLDKQGSIYNLLFSEEASPISGVLYQFNHKTVQETLAAIHIAKLKEDHQMFWEEHFCRPEMAEVWMIYCGLTKLNYVDLKELSYSVLSQRSREVINKEFFKDDDMVVMTSLFEANNSSLSTEIFEDLFKTSITAGVGSSYDAQVVRYSLQHHPTLQRLHIEGKLGSSIPADPVFTDELLHNSVPRLRELRCDRLSESDWTTLTKAFTRARHLEILHLPMYSRSENVEVVLSALTKLPALNSFTLDNNLSPFHTIGSISEDCKRIVGALEANNHLREFSIHSYFVNLSTITEHLCRNKTLNEIIIDLTSGYVGEEQLLKSLLVHREKCTVKMPLTRQQWCAVLSGLRDAKKLKELVVYMHEKATRSSIPDQSDRGFHSSVEVEEFVAASEHLVEVEVGYVPSLSRDVEDLVLSMMKGVSRNRNISKLGVVIQKDILLCNDDYLDQTRSVAVPILKIIATCTDHISCVRFECTPNPLVRLIRGDWCQLLVNGPMSRRECHLKLDLTPTQCGQLLSRVNDAKGLEELSLTIPFGFSHNVRDDVTVKAVKKVYSNCRLRKARLRFESHIRLDEYTNLLVAVVRGIASNNNDIDFVLEGDALKGDHIMSQLPPQSVERFEFVERRGWGFIISKPCAPTVAKRRLPLQASSPLSPTTSVGVTQATNKSSSPSSTQLSHPPVSSGTKSRIPLPTSSTSSLSRKIGIGSATEKSPSLSQSSRIQISSVMNTKSTPSARCSTERGPSSSNPAFQKTSDNKDIIKSTSDLLPYMNKMLAHLPLLGAVLGVEDYTSAVMKQPGDPQSRCIDILSHWIKVTPHPTWTIFCDRLERAKTFNNLRSKICRDKAVRRD